MTSPLVSAPRDSPKQRRYSMAVVTRARQLHEAEWTPTQIKRLLGKEFGVDVHLESVRTWVDPVYAEERRRWAVEHYRRKGREARARRHAESKVPVPVTRDEIVAGKLRRMLELREAGVAFSGIVAVLRLDFGDVFTDDQVRYACRRRKYPKVRSGVEGVAPALRDRRAA